MTEIEIHAVNAARGARLDDEDAAAAALGLTKWRCQGWTHCGFQRKLTPELG